MLDFTLKAYELYLKSLQNQGYDFILFRDFIPNQNRYSKYCLIRHDVDRMPKNALRMAKLENRLGIKSTYYFRHKPWVFKPDIIKEIEKLNHEVGYHYENLSDTNGDINAAIKDFELKLVDFRKTTPINTISMHGMPFKKYDNRDLWKSPQQLLLLKEKFNLKGEVYLDIDYTDICYINDTGRNWHSSKNNTRDITNSIIKTDFKSMDELLNYFNKTPHSKIVFQIHPERWSSNLPEWVIQKVFDSGINIIKSIIKKTFS